MCAAEQRPPPCAGALCTSLRLLATSSAVGDPGLGAELPWVAEALAEVVASHAASAAAVAGAAAAAAPPAIAASTVAAAGAAWEAAERYAAVVSEGLLLYGRYEAMMLSARGPASPGLEQLLGGLQQLLPLQPAMLSLGSPLSGWLLQHAGSLSRCATEADQQAGLLACMCVQGGWAHSGLRLAIDITWHNGSSWRWA